MNPLGGNILCSPLDHGHWEGYTLLMEYTLSAPWMTGKYASFVGLILSFAMIGGLHVPFCRSTFCQAFDRYARAVLSDNLISQHFGF